MADARDASRLAAIRYLERVQKAAFIEAGTSFAEANAWLEAHQRQAAAMAFQSVAPDHPGPPEAWAEEVWRSAVKEAREGGASRFELVPTYIILQDRIIEIAAGAAQLGIRSATPFIFGTVYAPRVNAEALVPPESNHAVLVFDGDLFTFCLLFSKAIVDAGLITINGASFQISDEEAIADRVRGSRELQDAFTAALEGYVLAGTPAAAPPYYALPEYATAARILWEGMERFVVAHEVQHVVAGHLNRSQSVAGVLPGTRTAAFVARREQEFEADRLALPLALAAADELDIDVHFGFLGVDLFFLCLDIAERGWSMVVAGDDAHRPSSKTHPTARERRESVRAEMRRINPRDATDSQDVADMFAQAAELLWREVKPRFGEHYKDRKSIKRYRGLRPRSSL
jgi:hypothetical protein